ncbi:hypothetical protein [Streptomyces cellostaticus]|uniref:hypothetical protein n=1 Tax=Streptomyces cellostaticus TaxID=67285 RepID=UPI002026AB93|nr:hypothetical protein [Streptomyces cellostaticus]
MKARGELNESQVAALARAMLDRAAAVAPEQVAAERPMFGLLSRTYFSDPRRALEARELAGHSGPLGFGAPEVAELLTPLFLAAASAVVADLTCRATEVSQELMRRLLNRGAPGPEEDGSADRQVPAPVAFTGDQLRAMRRIVAHTLVRHGGLSEERADLLAAAAVGDAAVGEVTE